MNSPAMLYSEYIFTSLKRLNADFIDINLHLERLEFQIKEYYFIEDAKSLIDQIKEKLFSVKGKNIRLRINVFSKKREDIFENYFSLSDLNFSFNISDLKEKRSNVKLKTFSFFQDQILSKFKLPNYSAAFYLKRVAKRDHYDDILYVSLNEDVIESSTSNIIFKIDQEWVTSKLCIYEGISRKKLIDSSKIIQKNLKIEDLSKATDAFLINSVEDYISVDSIDNKYHFSNENIMELFNE